MSYGTYSPEPSPCAASTTACDSLQYKEQEMGGSSPRAVRISS